MKSKIGFFINTIESRQAQIDKILRARPVTLKSPSNPGLINELFEELGDDTVFVAREQSLNQDFRTYLGGDSPEQAARRWMNDMRDFMKKSPFAYWESVNEMTDWGMLSAYGRFEAERVRLMAAEGYKACVGNFSIGAPQLSDHANDGRGDEWPLLYPMLEAANQYGSILGLHEGGALWPWIYYGPNQDEEMLKGQIVHFPEGYHEGWLGFRYRRVWRRHIAPNGWTNIRIILTEWCVDAVEKQMTAALAGYATGPWTTCGPAWEKLNGRSDDEVFYAEQCIWGDQQMQRDPYVIGCNLYVWGTLFGWHEWDIDGLVADILINHIAGTSGDRVRVGGPLAGGGRVREVYYARTRMNAGMYIRTGPGLQFPPIATVHFADKLYIMAGKSGADLLGREGKWLKVKTDNDLIGWIPAWQAATW